VIKNRFGRLAYVHSPMTRDHSNNSESHTTGPRIPPFPFPATFSNKLEASVGSAPYPLSIHRGHFTDTHFYQLSWKSVANVYAPFNTFVLHTDLNIEAKKGWRNGQPQEKSRTTLRSQEVPFSSTAPQCSRAKIPRTASFPGSWTIWSEMSKGFPKDIDIYHFRRW